MTVSRTSIKSINHYNKVDFISYFRKQS